MHILFSILILAFAANLVLVFALVTHKRWPADRVSIEQLEIQQKNIGRDEEARIGLRYSGPTSGQVIWTARGKKEDIDRQVASIREKYPTGGVVNVYRDPIVGRLKFLESPYFKQNLYASLLSLFLLGMLSLSIWIYME